MNATIVSNISGGVSFQQAASRSHSSLLLSSIEFSLTEIKTNFSASSFQGKYLTKLTGREDIFNGQNKTKQHCEQTKQSCDQNKTKQTCDQSKISKESAFLSMNGSKEKPSSEDSIPVPKVHLYTGKICVEWNQVYKIGAGLHNLGNTCFMNTVIQCLTYCPPLANYLLHDSNHSSKCTVTGFCMMCLLQKHMKRAIGKTGEVIKPIDMFHRLKLIARHFQHGRQEDAHEFLRYVIDHLWKACLPQANGSVKLDSASKETTIINKIFGGYHRSQVICLRCKKESNTFDHFMDFILDIKQNVMTLEKALERFTQPELLQQENCYKCPKCKMKVEAQKRFSVYRAPTVATFQLKRFDYNRSFGGKITKQITYPEKLNLRPYMSETKGDPVWYRLNAVLVHSGPTCNSGHYYCYVKNSNGLWYIMDDQRVHQVSLNQVLSQSAYVLFYIRMESSEMTSLKKCVDAKNTFMKGTFPNSHSSHITEVTNLKSTTSSESFSSSKLCGSPSAKSNHREMQTNGAPPLMRQPLSYTPHSGLVPYIEDSSESSDASESSPPQSVKHPSANSGCSPPHLEFKTKLSKSVFSTPAPSPKVSATESWIVTDAPHTTVFSSLNATGVTSTTNWQVIEASEMLDANDSIRDALNKTETSKHSVSSDEGSNATKKLTGCEGNQSSAQNCSFQNQFCTQGQTYTGKETDGNCTKRKSSDCHSNDTPNPENRHTPVPKKAKHSEKVPVMNKENGLLSSHVDTSDKQGQNCDNNSSRTSSLVNGFRNNNASFVSMERDRKTNEFSKERQSTFFLDSQHRKEKMTISNLGRNSSLYGAEIPTWKENGNDYRPSLMSAHEKRRRFDDYDYEFDQGKVRKSKMKEQHRYFRQKNPFQKYSDRHHGKHSNNNHHNYRKYDHNWQHNGHYPRYRNHHHRHY